jgi:TIR domain
MAFFFDRIVGATRIIAGDPAAFVRELAQRWHNRQVTLATDDPLQQMPDTMPRSAVFLSYSRDDVTAVRELVRGLRAAQVPIWIDRQRLVAGANYRRSLEFEVKHQCSFFLSVISRASESDPNRFVHTERLWAAQRHVDGYVFYIPVVIDETLSQGWKPQLEPSVFSQIHFEHIPGGIVTAAFAIRLRRLIEDLEFTSRPTI